MNRVVVDIKRIKESYIYIKHKSGLTIYLKPMNRFSSAVAIFATKYGSVDRLFRTKSDDDVISVPDGIAHYLEHKLFENEDGSITFELFAKNKANANAETSFNMTSYYFSSPFGTFLQSLKILINFVQTPYFTDENVEKERGIIKQEIKMNEDDPYWKTFFSCLQAMYKKSAVKIKIAGTVQSIEKIDKEALYRCYNSFYSPNNMAIIVAGNFNEEEVLKLINSSFESKKDVIVQKINEEEDYEVCRHYTENYMSLFVPVFSIGYKFVPKKGIELLKAKIGIKIFCEILLGEGSKLYEEFYELCLVDGGEFEYEILAGENYFSLVFSGASKDPKKVFEKICRAIEEKKIYGLEEEDFLLVKKSFYGRLVEEFSLPGNVAEVFLDSFIEDYEVLDRFEFVANIEKEDVEWAIGLIDVKNSSLAITFPNNR